MEIIAFCVITFEPIKIKTCSAPQNDRLNLSFVKYIHVDGEIWLKMVVKRLLVSLLTFVTPYMYSQVLLQNKDRDTLINF